MAQRVLAVIDLLADKYAGDEAETVVVDCRVLEAVAAWQFGVPKRAGVGRSAAEPGRSLNRAV